MLVPSPRGLSNHSLGSEPLGDRGPRSLTQGQHGLVVHPHDLPVQGLLRLGQHFPLLVREVDGHLIKEGWHLGQSGPFSGANGHVRAAHTFVSAGGALPQGNHLSTCTVATRGKKGPKPRSPCPADFTPPLALRQGWQPLEKPPVTKLQLGTGPYTPGIANPPSLQSWTGTHRPALSLGRDPLPGLGLV